MTPSAARAYLDSLHPTQIALGLDRMRTVLERLRSPELCAPAVHVAGTNGKGSVCAMAERALRAAGHRTGFYSSPHLLKFEERIRIDGEPIGEEQLASAVEQVREAGVGLDLTYFEFGTAMAFVAFRDAKVGAQVLETGLGGRLDATNLCVPIAAAITALGRDHTQILGDTLEKIAFEKAGILKPGLRCAVARPPAAAAPVLQLGAEKVGAELWVEGRDFSLEAGAYRGPSLRLEGVRIGLRGPHQSQNAAVALALLEIASRSVQIPASAMIEGIAEAEWPGRLDVWRPVEARPGVEVVLDGAHNPAAAEALANAVRQLWPSRDVTLVFGVLDDKELGPMLRSLLPLARRARLVTPKSPRAKPAASYLAEARALLADTSVEVDAESALRRALSGAGEGSLVLVAGSLYLVAEALALLGRGARRVRP